MASEAMCRGFKSLQARQSGPLAQLVEQLTLNQRVVGSTPTRPTTLVPSCDPGIITSAGSTSVLPSKVDKKSGPIKHVQA